MPSRNRAKRKNKTNRKNGGALRLYKGVDPTYGKTIERIVKYRDRIQLTTGQPGFSYTSTGFVFLNVHQSLVQSSDFTPINDSMQLGHLLEFQVRVYRSANDTQLANLGISAPTLFIGWFPARLAFTGSTDTLNSETGVVIPSLSLETHTKTFPIRPLQMSVADGSIYVYNPAIPTFLPEMHRLPGCLSIATTNTTNVTTGCIVFQIEVIGRFRFHCPV